MFTAKNKSLFVSIALCLSVSQNSFAQCNDWEKLLTYEGVYIGDQERDRFGNLYVVGWFNSDNFEIDGKKLTRYGMYSAFILKFNKDLTLQWAKSAGHEYLDMATVIEIDRDQNPVVAGYFYGGQITFDCITLHTKGGEETFVVKYNPEGSVMWALGTEGQYQGFAADLCISNTNQIILSTAVGTPGSMTFGDKKINGTDGYDALLASISPSGEVEWLRTFGGIPRLAAPDYILGMDVDSKQNIIITGWYQSDMMVLDEFQFGDNFPSHNYYVAKLNSEGKVLWVNDLHSGANGGFDVLVDKDDNIYTAGQSWRGKPTFDTITLDTIGGGDMFIAKYDTNGNILKAKAFGGTAFDGARKLALDAHGNIVVGGFFNSKEIQFDAITLNKPYNDSDIFVATLNTELETQSVKQVAGRDDTSLTSLVLDKAGNTWISVFNASGDEYFFGRDPFSSIKRTLIVSGCNSSGFDTEEKIPFTIHVGDDITKCPGEEVTVRVTELCQGYYTWSNGVEGPELITSETGKFWLRVVWNGAVATDTIVISNYGAPEIDLGEDRQICTGENVSWNVTQSGNAEYLWEDGSASSTRTVDVSGTYWVVVTGECEADTDSVEIEVLPTLLLDFGKDTLFCGYELKLDAEIPGAEFYQWQDNSTASSFAVTTDGTYAVTVSNKCEIVSDTITVTVTNASQTIIPNVVTPDGNQKNDTFVLSEAMTRDMTIHIYNRFGKNVFSSDQYENNWPEKEYASGIYFYVLKGSCFPNEVKGAIHLLTSD